jgi:outer membrane immunogenic protein
MGKLVRLARFATAVAVAGFSAMGTTAITFAADIPVKAPSPMVTSYGWTGFYVGLNAGYGWGRAKTDEIGVDPSIVIPAQGVGSLPTSFNKRVDSFIGGGQIGYNWQSGQYVLGIEADFAYIDLNTDSVYAVDVIAFNPALTTTQSSRLRWLGTVRPRVGWLWTPSTMIFATGGLAYGGAKGSTRIDIPTPGTCPLTNAFCAVGSGSKTVFGWTAGGGFEMLLGSNWSGKIEALYFDVGDLEYPVISTANFGIGGTEILRSSTSFTGVIVRAGLNYRFSPR